MYHYKLQVLILSQDNRIYDAVSALEPLAGFEHELLLRQSADAAVKTADVIVCELSGAVLAELVKNSKPDAAIVFCAEPLAAEKLDAAVYLSLTDLWITKNKQNIGSGHVQKLLWLLGCTDFLNISRS